jgi:nucleotide-binding universal stress UspA family protein
MKSILVATDGSEVADRAVASAARLAAAEGARLTIVNVLSGRPLSESAEHFAEIEFPRLVEKGTDLLGELAPTFMRLEPPQMIQQVDRQVTFLNQHISDSILSHAGEIARQAGVAQAATISAEGDAAQQIVAAAKKVDADLVVVGRRGVGAVAEMLLGSVSQKVLHRAHTDVLTVE